MTFTTGSGAGGGMAAHGEVQSWSTPVAPAAPDSETDLGCCEVESASPFNSQRVGRCHRKAHQKCSTCGAALCDVHAEHCIKCTKFFCEGCNDLHLDEPCLGTRTIAEMVEEVYRRQP